MYFNPGFYIDLISNSNVDSCIVIQYDNHICKRFKFKKYALTDILVIILIYIFIYKYILICGNSKNYGIIFYHKR